MSCAVPELAQLYLRYLEGTMAEAARLRIVKAPLKYVGKIE
jgi:hypothetical protein